MNTFLRSVVLAMGLAFATSAMAVQVDKIVAFGDSLSDNGNLYTATSRMHAFDDSVPATPASPPYYQGRFSDGPVWVEYLSQTMNKPLMDYAFGGSWAEDPGYSSEWFPPSLLRQVDSYLVANVHDKNMSQHLYTIWDGANDYLKHPREVESATSSTIAALHKAIKQLITMGHAKYFMVLNMPDLGTVPYGVMQGAEGSALLSQLSSRHNEKLAAMVQELRQEYPDCIFVEEDINAYMATLMATKSLFGQSFSVVNYPCYTGDFAGNNATTCSTPSTYLFWDVLHPTTAVNELIAQKAQDLLAEQGIN